MTNKVWRIWKYALGSFEDTKTARYDNAVCITRSIILLTYLITNCFITAGVIRHWGDSSETVPCTTHRSVRGSIIST